MLLKIEYQTHFKTQPLQISSEINSSNTSSRDVDPIIATPPTAQLADSIFAPIIAAPRFAESNQSSNSSSDPPQYKMSRSHTTITNLWREWFMGLGGSMSIKELERQYGHQWRGGSRSSESKFFRGRKLIIDSIEAIIEAQVVADSVAIEIFETKYSSCNNLNQYVKALLEENYKKRKRTTVDD